MTILGANTQRPTALGTDSNGAWDDLQGAVTEGSGGAALTFAAFRDTPFKLANFRDGQSDELHFVYQMSHRWDRLSSVRPHLHLLPLAASAGSADFEGYYYFSKYGVEIPALVGWTPFAASLVIAAAGANKPVLLSLGTIAAPSGARESDLLMIYMKRTGGTDTYGGDVAVMSSDVHFQAQKDGTDAEIPLA